jgi:hypothetical protein
MRLSGVRSPEYPGCRMLRASERGIRVARRLTFADEQWVGLIKCAVRTITNVIYFAPGDSDGLRRQPQFRFFAAAISLARERAG